MSLYQKILDQSKDIDWKDKNLSGNINIRFSVPPTHARFKAISEYYLKTVREDDYSFSEQDIILCDESLKQHLPPNTLLHKEIHLLSSTENKLKMLHEADTFVAQRKNNTYSNVIAIGGGVLINFGAYVAEKLNLNLIYIPTSIIAMSDASIGGKVRINAIIEKTLTKHAYKSFYEPSKIIIDHKFLSYLDPEQIRIGLAEVIKHAIYQSPLLTEYLLSEDFDPFKNKESLLRAILWTADLKRICLEIDPEESHEGSRKILRAAHDISDVLEEKSLLTLPHGKAVEKAMIEDLYSNKEKQNVLFQIYQKLGISYTTILS